MSAKTPLIVSTGGLDVVATTVQAFGSPALSTLLPEAAPKDRALPFGKQWLAHNGRSARLRRLKQATRGLVVSSEHETRIAAAVQRMGANDPEMARLFLLNLSREKADFAGVPFPVALDVHLHKLEAEAAEVPPA